MQALFEFLLAIVVEFVHQLLALVELIIHLGLQLIEFVAAKVLKRPTKVNSQAHQQVRWRQTSAAIILVLIAGALIAIAGCIFFENAQHQRQNETERHIAQKADALLEQYQKDRAKLPPAGPMNDRDAWGRPLELFVDELPGGALIVVRSPGRDGRPGTLDDLLAIRESAPGQIDFAKEIANRGVDFVKNRLNRLVKPK